MKTVLRNNAEVAHIWAQQKQSAGRAGNMFFEGPSIFSYGHHFEIARFITPDIVFFNPERYSMTTGRHQGRAYQAVNHKTVYTVPSFTDHTENALYLAKLVRDEIDSTSRAHVRFNYRLVDISSRSETARAYLKTFEKKINKAARKEIRDLNTYFHKVLPQNKIDLLKAREKVREENAGVRLATKRARIAEAQRLEGLKHLEDLENWKAGITTMGVYGLQYLPVALRIQGDDIETSHGARIPLLAARELWDKLTRKEPLHGLSLGDYTVTGFDGSILSVGCHRIPVKEVLRMARGLGWLSEEVTNG